jgi:hypothetical protein
LLAGPALVVKDDDILGWPRHVGHDEANTRVKFARMPLDLGDDTSRFRPASGLIVEVRIGTPHFIRRTGGSTSSQSSLARCVGEQACRILDALGFEKLIDIGIGEAGVGTEISARDLALIPRHDRLQNALSSIGAVNVTWAQQGASQVTELVEQK